MKYEKMKEDMGTALAWSLLVPGGGVFYAGGDNEVGAGLAAVETASLGMVVYVGNQVAIGNALPGDRSMAKFFSALFLATKIFEVSHAFHLVDAYNDNLLRTLNTDRQETPPMSLAGRRGRLPAGLLIRVGWDF